MKATSKAEARRRGRNSAKANITLVNGVGGDHTRNGRKVDHTATVKAQREKNGVPASLVADPLAGHELGKLRLFRKLYPCSADYEAEHRPNGRLYEAGIAYQEVRARFLGKVVGMAGTIQAQDVNRIGGTSGIEDDPERIATLRAMHSPMRHVLFQCGGRSMWTLLDKVIIRDEATNEIDRLSIGLRALAEWKDGR